MGQKGVLAHMMMRSLGRASDYGDAGVVSSVCWRRCLCLLLEARVKREEAERCAVEWLEDGGVLEECRDLLAGEGE